MFVENFINVLGVLVPKLLPSFAFIVLNVFLICKLSRGGLIWLGCKGDSLINTNAYEGIRGEGVTCSLALQYTRIMGFN